jgi:uncharacterized protein YkwD
MPDRAPLPALSCNDADTLSSKARRMRTGICVGICLTPTLAALAAAALAADPALARTTAQPCAGSDLRPSATNARAVEAAALCLLDEQRTARGLRPLRANHELQAVAGAQVQCMVRADSFADDCPAGQTPMARIAATYGRHAASISIGQDLGWGAGADRTPAAIVGAWMRSRPHRAIILTASFTDAAVGVTPGLPPKLGPYTRAATFALELALRRT